MFKRKNGVLSFLLVAVMLLGVGFAALTDTLAVSGSATVDVDATDGANSTFDADIRFQKATPDNVAVTTNISSDKDTLTITVPAAVLNTAGESTTITAIIENLSADYEAYVTLVSGQTQGNNFSVTCNWLTTDNPDGFIAKNGTATAEITIKLLTAPTEDIPAESFSLTYDVSTDSPGGNPSNGTDPT